MSKTSAPLSVLIHRPLRVLVVEDSPADAELSIRELKKAGFDVNADLVQTAEQFIERVRSDAYDIILADYRLPNWTGMDALEHLQRERMDVPLILLTGALGEEMAVECLKKGVSDYVLKDRLARLPAAVKRALEERTQRQKRLRTQGALQEANEKLTTSLAELQQRAHEATLLSELAEMLHTCLLAEEAYAVIAQFSQKLFPTDSGALYLLTESRNLVESVVVWGRSPFGEATFAPQDCWALRRGRLHLVTDSHNALVCGHLSPPLTVTSVCVPMMAQGDTLGVLHLHANTEVSRPEGAFQERSHEARTRLAVTLAEQIALALANLRLRERLRLQAIRDPLTDLYNRRYMQESLQRELHRAARKLCPLGMIVLDLDHFKDFNDTFGHDAGDTLLRALAQLLQRRTRREDIACRYGGEEFTVILPEAPLDVTRERAERLREELKRLSVTHNGQVLGEITLSAGVAVFPQHGATGEELLRAADNALYRAKTDGRDRVELAQMPKREAGPLDPSTTSEELLKHGGA